MEPTRRNEILHSNLLEEWPPSTIKHLATKFLQLAASNIQGGASCNITWTRYWTYWKSIQGKVERRMNESDTGNSGGIFSVSELKNLFTWEWTLDCGICFVNWIMLRFQFVTFLLCALRSENFDRFRSIGIDGITFHYEHRDKTGKKCPMATGEYLRVKNKKDNDETQFIAIVCTCPNGQHAPITTQIS